MQIIDGREIAEKIQQEVKDEIKRLGLNPGLAVILVGDNPASHLYVGLKEKACQEVGIKFERYEFRDDVPQSSILAKIQELNERDDIHGILVQVPLPSGYDEDVLMSQIDPKKDVDGFHQVNLRAILEGKPRTMSAVALAIVALIDEAMETARLPNIEGHKAVIIANRTEFVAPIEYLLEKRGALIHLVLRAKTVTQDIAAQLKSADILIVARGHANFVNADMIKDGAIVIDAGTNRLPDGRVVGDVDFESTHNLSGFITPVPGGVGPMTVAMLLKNALMLAQNFGKK